MDFIIFSEVKADPNLGIISATTDIKKMIIFKPLSSELEY